MPLYESHRPKSKKWGRKIVFAVCLGLVGFGVYKMPRFDVFGHVPDVKLIEGRSQEALDFSQSLHFGRAPHWNLQITNDKGGICSVDFKLEQNGQVIQLLDQKDSSNTKTRLDLAIAAANLTQLQEGALTGSIRVKNCALFSKKVKIDFKGEIDLSPPRVALLSTQHYINQGGADVAVYTVSQDAIWSGVRIGPYEFKGYPKPGSSTGEYFAFFVYSYEFGAGQPIEVVAYDAAGNEAKTNLVPAKFFAKEFRKRELPVDDNFIATKVADIIANTPGLQNTGDLLKNYLMVNRDLRKKNTQDLAEFSKKSDPTFYWKDAFKPLSASVEANFADYRSYIYQGTKVDEQVHLGFDLANFEQNPIYASNRGKILFAGYLGIYGNTVLIDHGYGLVSLYGHLSSLDVKEGDFVEKNQKIANSGATGLAGGDHLHFSLLIQGIQTNPVEFWDQHWIDDHVYLRLGADKFGKDAVQLKTETPSHLTDTIK